MDDAAYRFVAHAGLQLFQAPGGNGQTLPLQHGAKPKRERGQVLERLILILCTSLQGAIEFWFPAAGDLKPLNKLRRSFPPPSLCKVHIGITGLERPISLQAAR